MLRQNPHLLLMGTLGFSASDLAANSRGELSERQREVLKAARNLRIGRWTARAGAIWIVGLALHIDLLALLFSTAVIVSVIVAAWGRADDDLHGRVGVLTGRLSISTDFPLQWMDRIELSGERFHIPHMAGAAFQPGRIYRLYYTAATRAILSAELVA